MSGVSDKKLKNRTLQLRAGSEYVELIELIVNSANNKAVMAGGSQVFNNSDILKEAIKGLTGQDTYINIEGSRFAIKDLVDEELTKFDGKFQEIIDKDQLKNLLKIGSIRFINNFGDILKNAVEDIKFGKEKRNTINIEGVQSDLHEASYIIYSINKYDIENYFNYEVYENVSFEDVIERMYSQNSKKSLTLDSTEVDLEELREIKEEEVRMEIRKILQFNKMNNTDWNMKAELKEYIKECILDSEEFRGINAYKLKNDYNQKKIMTRLNTIIDCYIKDIARDL